MKVTMKVSMSGTRNGEPWPLVGQSVTLPNTEAAKLCEAGLAAPVADMDGDVEQRETPVDTGPEGVKENERDAVRSAKQAEKRAKAEGQEDEVEKPAKKKAN